jgi:hypothetical protein
VIGVSSAVARHAGQNLQLPPMECTSQQDQQNPRALRRIRPASSCQPRPKGGTLLKLTGDATRNVALVSNDFAGVGQAAEVGPNVPAGALSLK